MYSISLQNLFSVALPAYSGLRPLIQFRNHFLQTVGLLGRVNRPSQGHYLYTGQHKHRINTYIHQTSMPLVAFEPNPSVRASGYRVRLIIEYTSLILVQIVNSILIEELYFLRYEPVSSGRIVSIFRKNVPSTFSGSKNKRSKQLALLDAPCWLDAWVLQKRRWISPRLNGVTCKDRTLQNVKQSVVPVSTFTLTITTVQASSFKCLPFLSYPRGSTDNYGIPKSIILFEIKHIQRYLVYVLALVLQAFSFG
jgi:hypothetical protein